MMLPAAAPTILLYAQVRAHRRSERLAATAIFTGGYLGIWLAFSIAAAVIQLVAVGPSMTIEQPLVSAAILISAGLYQVSPFKDACLGRCRNPASFLSRYWQPGWAGAVRLGALHGLYCIGCCWMLMAILFVGGVMNLILVVILSVLVAAEKLFPKGEWLARAAGVGLIGWGVFQLA